MYGDEEWNNDRMIMGPGSAKGESGRGSLRGVRPLFVEPTLEGDARVMGDRLRIMMVGSLSPEVWHTCADLGPYGDVLWLEGIAEAEQMLTADPMTVLLVELREDPLALQLPGLAKRALDLGQGVVRLARDVGGFDCRWDGRVLHMPQGVRPEVLATALGWSPRKMSTAR